MRVLEVIANLAAGGAEKLLVDLCPRFRAMDVQADVYVLNRSGGPFEAKLEEQGTTLLSPLSACPYYLPLHASALREVLLRGAYDVVHSHTTWAQLWTASAVVGLPDRPLLLTTEHNTSNRRRAIPACRTLDRWMYSQYEAVACISEAVAEELTKWLSPRTAQTVVVPNGIDFAEYAAPVAVSKPALYGTTAPVILCTASLTPRKDQATLIRAISLVDGVHVFFAGDGPKRDELRKLAEATNTTDRVHFLGVRTDVRELVGAADLYVQPSLIEGFGIATVEAMAGGLPVIASAVPGLREVVGDGACFFKPGDYLDLANLIESLLRNPVLRRQISGRGRERAKLFDVERTAVRYARLYHEIAGRYQTAAAASDGKHASASIDESSVASRDPRSTRFGKDNRTTAGRKSQMHRS